MEKYLKMSDVFFANVEPEQLSGWKGQSRCVGLKRIQEAASHAINSHDELVEMNKELLAALEHLHFNAKSSGVEMGLALDVAEEAIEKAKGGAA